MTTSSTENVFANNKRTIMDGNSTSHASKRFTTIMAVLTLCLGLVVTQQSYAAGVWTNEPAGASVVLDCPFNSGVAGCGIFDVYSSSQAASDQNAPVSASSVVTGTLSAGSHEGGAQLVYGVGTPKREIFVGLAWRTNSQFEGRPVGNKLFFILGPRMGGVFLFNASSLNNGTGQLIWSTNTLAVDNSHICQDGLLCYPNVGNGTVSVGTWYKIEVYFKASTTATSRDGIFRWWINGVLVGNYTNANYSPDGYNEWQWNNTRDGTVNPAPSQDWTHFIDHLHISVPNGGAGTDNPPGPPAAPAIQKVTVP